MGSTCYDATTNAGVDVFAITAGGAAIESAIPPAVRVLDEGYVPMDDVRAEEFACKHVLDQVNRCSLCITERPVGCSKNSKVLVSCRM